MPDRSYSGDPLDHTWQDIKDRPYKGEGKTIGSTPSDETGNESTSLEPADSTDLQGRIIETHVLNPDLSVREIADRLECDFGYVAEVLRRRRGESRYQVDEIGDMTPTQQEIIQLQIQKPEMKQREIAEKVGVSEAMVSKVLSANKHLVREDGGYDIGTDTGRGRDD